MKLAFGFAVLALTVVGCGYFNDYFGLEEDNIFEEAIEYQIKEHSGVEIDLTPGSPE